MTDLPENSSRAAGPAASEATGDSSGPEPRRHRMLVGALFTLATILGVLAVLAVWANRQALNTDNWTQTSTHLLADRRIQAAVAAYSVNQLFSSGVPKEEITSVLPAKLQPLAGPITSGLQQLAGQAAPKLLATAQVQEAWRQANRAAHTTLLKIIDGGNSLASTRGGVVTLNLHQLITELATTLGVQSQVAAVQSKLKANTSTVTGAATQAGVTLPPSDGQLVILRSDQLKSVQDGASAIKSLALVLPLAAFLLFAVAVWLSRGHRRESLRLTGWCFVGIGLLVLIVRRVLGNYIVNTLVRLPANRPAAHDTWTIGTTLLYDIAVALVAYGLVFVAAAWLAGRTRPATAVRRALAPTLRNRPAVGYIVVYIALLLLILWGPTPATRQLPYIVGFIVLLALGVHALRGQTAREFPAAQAGDSGRSVQDWTAQRRQPSGPAPGVSGRVHDLERLAQLHDGGALTDAEFATEKAALVNGS